MNNKNNGEINLFNCYKLVTENSKIFIYCLVFSLLVSGLYLLLSAPLYKSSISIYEHGQSSSVSGGGMNFGDISSIMQMMGGNTNQADTSIHFYIP